MEEGVWRTINGVHVLIGKDGSILKGPKSLQKSDIQKRLKKQFEKKLPNATEIDDVAYHASNSDFEKSDVVLGLTYMNFYRRGGLFERPVVSKNHLRFCHQSMLIKTSMIKDYKYDLDYKMTTYYRARELNILRIE